MNEGSKSEVPESVKAWAKAMASVREYADRVTNLDSDALCRART
jgi:hypothetical protein